MDSTSSAHYLDLFDDIITDLDFYDEFSIRSNDDDGDEQSEPIKDFVLYSEEEEQEEQQKQQKQQEQGDSSDSSDDDDVDESMTLYSLRQTLFTKKQPTALSDSDSVQSFKLPVTNQDQGMSVQTTSPASIHSSSRKTSKVESQAFSFSFSSDKKPHKKRVRTRRKKKLILINAIKSKQSNLSCAIKQGHDLYFSTETHFFGCYWRNKSSSLCGFPTAQGLDYMTFQAQNRNQNCFTKTVVVGFEIDAESMSQYQTFIFKTELNAFRDLPDNDYSLIGNIGTFADTIKPFSFYVAVPASEAIAIPPVNSTESLNSSTQLNSSTAFTEFTAFTPKKYKISVEITPNKWTLAAKMGNVKGQTKIDMIHSPITNISNADKERIPHPSSTTSVKTILVKNLSCLNVMVYGTKKSCQTFTGTSEAEAATRGPAKMISKKPMSPIVVADSSSSSSCINTECEILGVLRSPAFLVGSSRSLRNKYSIPFHKGKFGQRIQQTCTSSVKTLHCAASVSETNNTSTFQSISSISSDGTLSADFTDSSEHSREHTCSPELSAEKEVEPSVRPNKRAKISNIDNNNGGNDDNGNTNTNVGSEIMPIEFLLGLTNSCC